MIQQPPYFIDIDTLRNLGFQGEIETDAIHRSLYANSASLVEIFPSGVCYPKDSRDVSIAVEYCSRNNIPLTARGAGSGTAGQNLGRGLILDFSVYMNRILKFDPTTETIVVEPGVVADHVNDFLNPYGYFFPPDPSSSSWCTIGGMVANNAGGSHSVKYGATQDYVVSLEVILFNGERVIIEDIALEQSKTSLFPANASKTLAELIEGTLALVQANQKILQNEKPQSKRSSSGFNLFNLLNEEHAIFRLPQLFCASEGTLGIITAITLKVIKKPDSSAGLVVQVNSYENMIKAVQTILPYHPSQLELIDRTIIDIVADVYPESCHKIHPECQSLLLIEMDDSSSQKNIQDIHRHLLTRQITLSMEVCIAMENMSDYQNIRKLASPILSRRKGYLRPARWIEDCAVDPSRLHQFIQGMKTIFQSHGIQGYFFGHAGDGILHVNPPINLMEPGQIEIMEAVVEETAHLLYRLKGSLSGEHGDGFQRTPYLRIVFPESYSLFAKVKQIWDPHNLFNPGIIVDNGDRKATDNLRYLGNGRDQIEESIPLSKTIIEEIDRCHGCGKCREYCPAMQINPKEEHTPRAKTNIIRDLLYKRLDKSILTKTDFKNIIDTCLACGRCEESCPSGVNIAKIAILLRELHFAYAGIPFYIKQIANPYDLGKKATLWIGMSNKAIHNKLIRRIMEKTHHFAPDRHLLPLDPYSNRMIHGKSYASPELIYFSGCFANFYDFSGEGKNAIKLLDKSGIFYSIFNKGCCGIAQIANGLIEDARLTLSKTLLKLKPYIEQDIPIVFSAISCYTAIKKEAPLILPQELSKKASDLSMDMHQFLFEKLKSKVIDLSFQEKAITIGYHHPCHYRTSGLPNYPVLLLQSIPGIKIVEYDAPCCGMAGTFGLKKEYMDNSLKIGRVLLKRIQEQPTDLICTPCGTCAMQIFHLTGTKPVHPLELLGKSLLE